MIKDAKVYRIDRFQYHTQLLHAEKELAALEQSLRDQGFVNTLHDCWEQEEKA
jgi:hypothetical protein